MSNVSMLRHKLSTDVLAVVSVHLRLIHIKEMSNTNQRKAIEQLHKCISFASWYWDQNNSGKFVHMCMIVNKAHTKNVKK